MAVFTSDSLQLIKRIELLAVALIVFGLLFHGIPSLLAILRKHHITPLEIVVKVLVENFFWLVLLIGVLVLKWRLGY